MSRVDYYTRFSKDPAAVQLCEEYAEESKWERERPDESDGWQSSRAEDRWSA